MTEHRAAIDRIPNVYLIEGRAGDYEPRFWTLGVWASLDKATAEAARLNEQAKAFWKALQELGEGPVIDVSEDELRAYFDRRDELIEQWHAQVGDNNIDEYDETIYHVLERPFFI